jgi:hypothetical protein
VKRDERGLALVELLAAAGLIALGLAGVLVVVPVASHGVQESGRLSTAAFLAEQRLEQVRNARWSKVPDIDCIGLGSSGAPTVPAGKTCTVGAATLAAGGVTFADEPDASGYPGYGSSVRVRDCGAAACAGVIDADLRLVTVAVTYTPPAASGLVTGPRTVALNLLVARR